MARLESHFDYISQRLNHIDARFTGLEARFDIFQAQLNARIDGWLRWVLGSLLGLGATILTMWATIIAAIVIE